MFFAWLILRVNFQEPFAFGGENEQARRLMADGVEVVNGKVDLKKYGI